MRKSKSSVISSARARSSIAGRYIGEKGRKPTVVRPRPTGTVVVKKAGK